MAKSFLKQGNGKRVGCLLTVIIIAFLLASGIYFVLEPVRETKRLEQVLLDKFGSADQFTPAWDGAVAAHRIDAFIRVRESVQPACTKYQYVLDSVINLESLDTDKKLSGDKKFSQGLKGFKGLISAPRKMVGFIDVRNKTLLAEEMGLGEYLYLYLAAYGKHLAAESTGKYSDMEEAYISKRSRKNILQILENQLSAMEARQDGATVTTEMAELRAEIGALEDGSHASPWPDGPAGLTADSFNGYRERLSELYCIGMVRVELLQKR